MMTKNTKTSDVFRNMLLLASGASAAKLISFLSVPILSRIYTPEEYGLLSLLSSTLLLLLPLGTLRYPIALPLPKYKNVAFNLFTVSCFFLLSFSIILLISYLIVDYFVFTKVYWFHGYIPFIFTGFLASGIYELLHYYLIRERNFSAIAKVDICQSIVSESTKVLLGLLYFKGAGLLSGQVLQYISGSLFQVLPLKKTFSNQLSKVSIRRMCFVSKRYADFPKFRLPSQFLLVLTTQMPILFMGTFFGKEWAGQLGLAMMTLALPMTLLGQTTSQAYYSEISKIGKDNPLEILELSNEVVKNLFFFALVPFLILLFFAPHIFVMTFGSQWKEAGKLASVLSFFLISQFVSAPLVNVLTVLENQRWFLFFNFVRLVIVLSVFSISRLLSLEPVLTIAIYSSILALHYAYFSFSIFRLIKKQRGKL